MQPPLVVRSISSDPSERSLLLESSAWFIILAELCIAWYSVRSSRSGGTVPLWYIGFPLASIRLAGSGKLPVLLLLLLLLPLLVPPFGPWKAGCISVNSGSLGGDSASSGFLLGALLLLADAGFWGSEIFKVL